MFWAILKRGGGGERGGRKSVNRTEPGNITTAKFWTHKREFFITHLKAFSATEADGNLDKFNSQSSTLASQIPVQA